jgi:hypothetical protein
MMLFHLTSKNIVVKIFQVMALFDGAVDRLLILRIHTHLAFNYFNEPYSQVAC